MACGCDEVTVARIEVESIKGFELCEGIWHVTAHAVAGLGEQFIEKAQAALAFEAFEEGGDTDLGIVDLGELLEKIAAALEDAEASTNPGFHPGGIVEGRAVATVFCGVQKLKKRLEEFFAND